MRRLLIIAALLLAAPGLWAASEDELLEPNKAFRFSAQVLDPSTVEVRYAIADGYYLYRERFRFAAEPASVALGVPQFPKGEIHEDKFFGKQETYRKELRIRLPLEGGGSDRVKLRVTSQGCADIGVCYVPQEQSAELRLASAGGLPASILRGDDPLASRPESARPGAGSEDVRYAGVLESGKLWLVVGVFFGAGLLLTFTPCVLPMIPILSSIIAGEGAAINKLRALLLSLAYVLGMAVAYAVAGVAAALSGALIAAALQNAWVLGGFALVFVILALSMFGFYELRLPGFLHHHLHGAHRRLRGGQIASVAAMGMLSAVIVSPCVAAPLAGALLYISQTRDVTLGASALVAMALGMGVPLVAVGVSEGALLPRAGAWMEGVRRFFGVLLLGVAIWILAPVVPPMLQMLAWSALAVVSAMFLRALDALPVHATGWARLFKGVGIMLLVAGIALLVGALAGSRDPLRPLAGLTASTGATSPLPWTRVSSTAELDDKLRQPGRPVMLDFYADWCVSCKEMESFTFSDERVRAQLGTLLLLQADVTRGNEADRALLKRFSLFGPPGIIFFDAQGREIKGLRVIGYQNAERFLKTLSLAAAP